MRLVQLSPWVDLGAVIALAAILQPAAIAGGKRQITITTAVPTAPADGRSTIFLTLDVREADGSPVPNGTVVPLRSRNGSVSFVGATTGGRAFSTLTSSTWPGDTRITALGYVVDAPTLSFERGEPTSVQLHLHGSFSEGAATSLDHTVEAEAFGIDVLWWTDHDIRYTVPEVQVDMLDFENGKFFEDLILEGQTLRAGMISRDANFEDGSFAGTASRDSGHDSTWGMNLTGSGSEPYLQRFARWAVRDTTPYPKSTLADLTVRFSMRQVAVEGAEPGELLVRFPFSRDFASDDRGLSAPDWDEVVYYHSADNLSLLSDATTTYIPIVAEPGEWVTVEAPLSELAEGFTRGPDQALNEIEFEIRASLGQTASYDIDNIEFDAAYLYDDLRDRQREYLADLPYSARQLVGSEISAFGTPHLNAFGEDVPLLPYGTTDFDPYSAVEFVHDHGGLVSWNHMFGLGGTAGNEEEKAEIVAATIADWTETRAYGADLLEVGYRKRLLDMDDFLTVWDATSLDAGFLTGIGTTDEHDVTPLPDQANNFVTWLAPATTDPEDLLYELERGNAWFGDPTRFPMDGVDVELLAVEAQAVMGQAVVGAVGAQTIVLRVDPLEAGWWVVPVLSGDRTADPKAVALDGPYELTLEIDPATDQFVRFEVYEDLSDSPLLVTNPIYFTDDAAEVPAIRLPVP